MASHGISRTEYAQSRNDQVKEREQKKLKEYLVLAEQTKQKRSEGDYSLATLELTSKLLKINPEYYTIWNYRRQILLHTLLVPFEPRTEEQDKFLEALRSEHQSRIARLLKEELGFLLPLLQGWPKCYWLWNHRLWTLEQSYVLLSPEESAAFWIKELALVSVMLTRDERNFHGWMYRRIVVSHIENPVHGKHKSMVKEEFEYTKRMVQSANGMSNYSAWHQRSVLIPRYLEEEGRDQQEKMDFLEDELELINSAISTNPEDQSLWFYHRWVVSANDKSAIAPGMPPYIRIGMVGEQIFWLKELLQDHPHCKYVLKALVLYVQLVQELRKEPVDEEDQDGDEEEADEDAENREIQDWLRTLQAIDPMRRGRYQDLGKSPRS